jgi:hypothetical protein
MYRKKAMLVVLIAVMITLTFQAMPARAANVATINAFHATCRSFSVDVAVTGVTDDSAGFDRFRYLITDGSGNRLYQEDSARQVGVTDRAVVVDLPYTADPASVGNPARNPIQFSVIDLDAFDKPVATLQQITINGACPVSKTSADSLAALLPSGVKGNMLTNTTLYTMPGGEPLSLSVPRGREFTALYRSADNAWVALYVGGENLVWVPAGSIDLDLLALTIMPNRIDRSQQVTGAVIPSIPVATARMNYTLNFRVGPSIWAARIGRIPWKAIVPVYGRSANAAWVFVTYNGIGGWVSSWYIRLIGATLYSLPVVG